MHDQTRGADREIILHLRTPLSTKLKVSRLADTLLERGIFPRRTMASAIDWAADVALKELGR